MAKEPDRYSQAMSAMMALILAWILQALISSTQKQREFTHDMLDRLSALEVRFEQLDQKCDTDQ